MAVIPYPTIGNHPRIAAIILVNFTHNTASAIGAFNPCCYVSETVVEIRKLYVRWIETRTKRHVSTTHQTASHACFGLDRRLGDAAIGNVA